MVRRYRADSADLARVSTLTIADSETDSLENLGTVVGLGCRSMWNERSQEAIDQVRIKAAMLGATTISAPQCETSNKTDWVNNCMWKVTCTAEAFR